jgi:CysZ protein
VTTPLGQIKGAAGARFVHGVRYLIRGFKFPLIEHPRLIGFVVAPALINTLLFVGLLAALSTWGGGWATGLLDGVIDGEHAWYLVPFVWLIRVFWWLFLAALIGALSFVTVYLVGGVIAAPFNEVLSEKVEAIRLGTPEPPFDLKKMLSDALFAMGQELRRVAFLIIVFLVLLPLHFVPVFGTFIWAWVGFLILAMDQLDIPMARHRYRFVDRVSALKRNMLVGTGFGAACAAFLWVPLLNFLCLPAAVVGGTLFYADLLEAGAVEGADISEEIA